MNSTLARSIKEYPTALASRLAANRTLLAATVIFLLNAFLVSAGFFPDLSQINAWDEAVNVNSGRLLLQGEWPIFSNNPLVALFYAATYVPYVDSAFWLVHSTSLGRVILFGLVWIGAYAVGRRMSPQSHPLVMSGLLLVSAIPVSLLSFPSDALYVGLAALGFSRFLAYIETNQRKHLWQASGIIGLAALARNDGLILGVGLIALSALFAQPVRQSWRASVASAVPFVAIVAGYVFLAGLQTGRYELGTLARTYDNFEAGHQVIYGGEGQVNPVLEAKLEARRVFGTPEENRNSIFRAIIRNPQAYADRLGAVVRNLPDQLLTAYGKRLGLPVFIFALRGAWELVRRRRFPVLIAMGLWAAPLLSGLLITLFRIGHLRFPFYLIYAVAAVGLVSSMNNLRSRREKGILLLVLTGCAVYGLADSKLAITYASVLVLGALALGSIWQSNLEERSPSQIVPAIILLAAGLMLHGDYPGPKDRTLGDAPDEQGVQYLIDHFKPGTRVAAGSPGPIYTARMTYMGLTSLDVPRTVSAAEFLGWMRGQGIEAIYVDPSLYSANPYYWEQISSRIGDGLDRVFQAGEGDIQVLEFAD